ncbi:LysR family transcriptional regulator [Candidimonas nitroreducens]|uniref:LysR family transcriptional regulator n=1 Tax=Candidimonas nitroreducens TaxID=683354 RepID=A0A225MBF4_9BURK|nr:LysR family transcriptional regulator [Candidimonas nitroreducens]OWT56951.1 LysR family transcriptional regulator [Candidimonas nitroreducens]
MNPTALEYFVRIAQSGSISRTAIEAGIEQSTMTRHIARLEAELKVRLFHRSGRGVVLTDAGALLLTRARKVAEALDETRKLAVTLADEGPSELVIAAQPTIAQRSFAAVARALRACFPDTRLHMVETLGHQIINSLADGKIDVALLYVPNTQAGTVDMDVLLHEPLYLILPPDYPPAATTTPVTRMFDQPLILPGTPHGVRGLVESLALSCNRRLHVEVECDGSNAITKNLVRGGVGCAVLPLATVAEEVALGQVQASRLVEPEVIRQIAIATARNRPPVIGQWDILQTLRQAILGQTAQGNWPGATEAAGPAGAGLEAGPPDTQDA